MAEAGVAVVRKVVRACSDLAWVNPKLWKDPSTCICSNAVLENKNHLLFRVVPTIFCSDEPGKCPNLASALSCVRLHAPPS